MDKVDKLSAAEDGTEVVFLIHRNLNGKERRDRIVIKAPKGLLKDAAAGPGKGGQKKGGQKKGGHKKGGQKKAGQNKGEHTKKKAGSKGGRKQGTRK